MRDDTASSLNDLLGWNVLNVNFDEGQVLDHFVDHDIGLQLDAGMFIIDQLNYELVDWWGGKRK